MFCESDKIRLILSDKVGVTTTRLFKNFRRVSELTRLMQFKKKKLTKKRKKKHLLFETGHLKFDHTRVEHKPSPTHF